MIDAKIEENHKRYVSRCDLFKSFGYDMEKEREIVLKQALPIKGRILEVGTGKGHFAIMLAREGYSFTSIDISPDQQEFGKMNLEYFGLRDQVDFRISDARTLPFGERTFDIIFSVNAVHHLADPFEVMEELLRVLSPEGKIIVSDFSEKGMEMVARVHESEGQLHPQGKATIKDIKDFFAERNYATKVYQTLLQETVMVYGSSREGR